ncbi:MAG: YerC/YecD family TrpR-related protein [Pseudobdellovibrionaceae bacterium]
MKKNREPDDERVKALCEALLALETAQETRLFLDDICTPAEIEALADRWQVAGLLYKKKPYRQISEETGVSLATVTRVARCVFTEGSGYTRIIERLGKT